jgi:hypothetical protein
MQRTFTFVHLENQKPYLRLWIYALGRCRLWQPVLYLWAGWTIPRSIALPEGRGSQLWRSLKVAAEASSGTKGNPEGSAFN